MASSLLPLLLLCCISTPLASAKVRHFKWEVGYIYWSADCEERLMIGINGRFPGPTIRARTGDTIVVEVKNSLPTEGVSIHWHGIRQLGTPWFDGTASISQCAINPIEGFVYRFEVDKAGTYMYHGHYRMQRAAGLYGSLIVEAAAGEEPFRYDGELNLLLSDWWHASSLDQMAGLSSRPFRWIGEAQTLLINGRGQYNCSLAAHLTVGMNPCEIKSQECAPVVLPVLPNKTYRLRIASITSLASLNLAIGGLKDQHASVRSMINGRDLPSKSTIRGTSNGPMRSCHLSQPSWTDHRPTETGQRSASAQSPELCMTAKCRSLIGPTAAHSQPLSVHPLSPTLSPSRWHTPIGPLFSYATCRYLIG